MKRTAKIISLVCALSFAVSATYAQLSVGVSVRIGPPALPVYVQPPCPVDGYMWQPGYWAYNDDDGYYWVPGVWVAPPDPGLYWTPCYWGFAGGVYGFHAGYWGPHVGFYGGINYGFGYSGYGYGGGRWDGGRFRYNTAVVNINRTVIHNTYVDRTVINNRYVNNHTSFNGPGGVSARPRPEEQAAMRDRHIQPTAQQMSHQQVASHNRNQFASVNKGRPAAAAMNRVNGRAFTPQGKAASPSAFRNHASARPFNATQGARPTNNTGFGKQQQHNQAPQQQRAAPPQQRANLAQHQQQRQQRSFQQQPHRAFQQQPQQRPQQRSFQPQQQRMPQQQRAPQMQQRPMQQQRPQGGGGHHH